MNQWDPIPGNGRYFTTGWPPVEVIVDRCQMRVPAESPVGVYQLITGMYDARAVERLPAFTPDGLRLPGHRTFPREIEMQCD